MTIYFQNLYRLYEKLKKKTFETRPLDSQVNKNDSEKLLKLPTSGQKSIIASFDDTFLEFGVTILRYRKTPFCVGGKFLEILIDNVSLCQAPQPDPLCKISCP